MTVAIALFTADLRTHDNPVLRGALGSAERIVPLFVLDDGVREAGFATPNRAAFLAGCLSDLDASLRERGGRLVMRSGDTVREVCRVAEETGAVRVHVAGDVSGFAQRRERRLREALSRRELTVHADALAVVPPGAVTPWGKDHFGVFTPYFRRWCDAGSRRPLEAPRAVPVAPAELRAVARGVRDRPRGTVARAARGRREPRRDAG